MIEVLNYTLDLQKNLNIVLKSCQINEININRLYGQKLEVNWLNSCDFIYWKIPHFDISDIFWCSFNSTYATLVAILSSEF